MLLQMTTKIFGLLESSEKNALRSYLEVNESSTICIKNNIINILVSIILQNRPSNQPRHLPFLVVWHDTSPPISATIAVHAHVSIPLLHIYWLPTRWDRYG